MDEKFDIVRDALAAYEPLYILKRERPVSDVWGVHQQFMSGNPQPSHFIVLCQELSDIERKMGECIYWVKEMSLHGFPERLTEPLLKRCRAVKTSVEYRRKVVMSISNSIAYTYKDFQVDYIVDSRFEFKLTPLVEVAPPRQLNDHNFISTTTTDLGNFAKAMGRTTNRKKGMWTTKAKQVILLETYLRENNITYCTSRPQHTHTTQAHT
jgi:hypothetical protein